MVLELKVCSCTSYEAKIGGPGRGYDNNALPEEVFVSGGDRGGLGGYSPKSEHARPLRMAKAFFGDF